MTPPPHHRADGRFANPWPEAQGDDALRKRFREVAWQWMRTPKTPAPGPADLPVVASDIAYPNVEADEIRVTWIGHATFLIQLPELNILTDPIWSTRASPLGFGGAPRFVPASPPIDQLPPIQAVLLSHDHYDHLDRNTVVALNRRFGYELRWYTPLGYQAWFRRQGIHRVTELDWWGETDLRGGRYRAVAAPARHWTRRTPGGTNSRLWCSWAILPRGPEGPRVYFAGDSGYAPFFKEVGQRLGPFDTSLIPIGAYEPRWFMAPSHMNPEEAVQVYQDLGGRGTFVPTHWGTFRLTLEPPLEPPVRARTAWSSAGLAEDDFKVMQHGETLVIDRGTRAPSAETESPGSS